MVNGNMTITMAVVPSPKRMVYGIVFLLVKKYTTSEVYIPCPILHPVLEISLEKFD
jgi:hypothetical protein